MADEAVIIEVYDNPVRFTVADGTGIEKGTVMQLSTDPRTITATSAACQNFAGIAAEEKVASDGATSIGVYTKGIFDLKCSGGAIAVGDWVITSGANLIASAGQDPDMSGAIIGKALETAAAGTAETIAVAVGIY